MFRQFSFPGGIPSHVAPEIPGSIHEGGELGYALTHAFGAAFDNPDLLVCAVVGDGEAETGPLATSWHSNKFLNPVRDGAVLLILHLNGYKIAQPAVLARIPQAELDQLMRGYGYQPFHVTGDDPEQVHQRFAAVLDTVVAEITRIQQQARAHGDPARPLWPMIVLRTPKGWTGPSVVDGAQVEGTWRSHQVPVSQIHDNPEHLAELETLAAVDILRRNFPDLKVRVVNVVDLMCLQDEGEHPHGISNARFDALFTSDRPVIFAYHGYPWLIHRLTYKRTNHNNVHVRGYIEEGTTTTPFDMAMMNNLDRFHLVIDVIDRVRSLGARAAHVRQDMVDARIAARAYTRDFGTDIPEISDWAWPY